MKRERLDILLTKRGLSESREKAKRNIMAGLVYVDGVREDKPGAGFPEDARIELRGSAMPYVSRGGLKLEKAIRVFSVDPAGRVCADVGASTGGFTDCMLQNGAAKVYAIDVGRGQLDWRLRKDERVVCMERTNIRYVRPEDLPSPPSLITVDVSFISLSLVLPVLKEILAPGGQLLCLIKPQFEAGREQVGRKGVIRESSVQREVIERIIRLSLSLGFCLEGLDYSPIKGPEGNIEYLCLLREGGGDASIPSEEEIRERAERTVRNSHEALDRGRSGETDS